MDNQVTDKMLNEMRQIAKMQNDFRKKYKLTKNPFKDSNYKEYAVVDIVRRHIDPTITVAQQHGGADAVSANFGNIELKSSAALKKLRVPKVHTGKFSSSVSWMYDKQNDAKRRENTLKYDCQIYTIHDSDEADPVWVFYVCNPETIARLNELFQVKQGEIIKIVEDNIKNGTRIWGNLTVYAREIFEIMKEINSEDDFVLFRNEEGEYKRIFQTNLEKHFRVE